jgi:polyisoprenoid-binding protein YceI
MKLSFTALLICAVPLLAQNREIDIARSAITIHVGKAGLLSAAGHEHWIAAPISSGFVNESESRVEFTVETAKMRVKPDPKVDEKTQATIQKDMEEMTLDVARYREIKFQSTRVEKSPAGWNVTGTLSLHGVSKPVTIDVKRDGGAFTGRAVLKQTEFGIKPISVAGGTIKIKNEIEIEFQIFTR